MRRPPLVLLTILVAVLPAMTACGAEDRPAAAPPPPVVGTLEPAVGSGGGRLVQVRLTSTLELAVRSVRLQGAGFVQVPAQPATGTLAPGTDLVLPLEYGPVLCDGRAAPTVVVLETTQGAYQAPVDDDALLPGLRAAECAQDEGPPAA